MFWPRWSIWRRESPASCRNLQFAFVFNLIPHALVPLAALLYATGIIQDEVEEQTLTYLLLRPLPRWALYLIKLLATMLMTSRADGGVHHVPHSRSLP